MELELHPRDPFVVAVAAAAFTFCGYLVGYVAGTAISIVHRVAHR